MARGFSLVETIVATSLLAAALVALAHIVGVGLHTGFVARTRTTTTMLAEQKMEELRARAWPLIAAAGSATDYLDVAGTQVCAGASVPCAAAGYIRRWSAVPAPFDAGIVIIEVHVAAAGHAHGSATLVTARSRRTP